MACSLHNPGAGREAIQIIILVDSQAIAGSVYGTQVIKLILMENR